MSSSSLGSPENAGGVFLVALGAFSVAAEMLFSTEYLFLFGGFLPGTRNGVVGRGNTLSNPSAVYAAFPREQEHFSTLRLSSRAGDDSGRVTTPCQS